MKQDHMTPPSIDVNADTLRGLAALKANLDALARSSVPAATAIRRFAAILTDRPLDGAHEFINDWAAFDVDAIDWEFAAWDPPDGRFVTRHDQGLLPRPPAF